MERKTQFRERKRNKERENKNRVFFSFPSERKMRVTGFCLLVGVAMNPDVPKWTN